MLNDKKVICNNPTTRGSKQFSTLSRDVNIANISISFSLTNALQILVEPEMLGFKNPKSFLLPSGNTWKLTFECTLFNNIKLDCNVRWRDMLRTFTHVLRWRSFENRIQNTSDHKLVNQEPAIEVFVSDLKIYKRHYLSCKIKYSLIFCVKLIGKNWGKCVENIIIWNKFDPFDRGLQTTVSYRFCVCYTKTGSL